jgi:hypothetical protein
MENIFIYRMQCTVEILYRHLPNLALISLMKRIPVNVLYYEYETFNVHSFA